MITKNLGKNLFKNFNKNFSSKTRVTFIGLGNMGNGMADNLLKSGQFLVSGFDAVPEVQEKFNKKENTISESFSDAIQKSEYIMTMLPNTDIVRKVRQEIYQAKPRAGSKVIDSSTINPMDAKKFCQEAEGLELVTCDAPVSGGFQRAVSGELTFMVGTKIENFDMFKLFLSFMGTNIWNCGEYGTGGIVKVCNNVVLGASMGAYCEALAMGKKLGMDPVKIAEVLNTSTVGTAWHAGQNCPVPGFNPDSPANRDYNGGFGSDLMCKDLKIGVDISNEIGTNFNVIKAAHRHYEHLKDKTDMGKKDFGVLYKACIENKV